jgi:hypothetical protein
MVFVPPLTCQESSLNAFCYICGEMTFKSLMKKCYEHYFGCKVGDQDKPWAKGSRCMPFAIPMVWREPMDHVSDCYFCLTRITGEQQSTNTLLNILIHHLR